MPCESGGITPDMTDYHLLNGLPVIPKELILLQHLKHTRESVTASSRSMRPGGGIDLGMKRIELISAHTPLNLSNQEKLS